jgi:hypothetical protein
MIQNQLPPFENQPPDNDLSMVLIHLLKGVVYQDKDAKLWAALLQLQARVRDYMTQIGLELMLDEAEGYAFLRSQRIDEGEAEHANAAPMPRLIARRQISFPVSLLLALLRKKLAEFDASGGDTRLILSREDMVDLIRLFTPDSSNEAKLVDQIERHINKVVELGFLRRLKPVDANTAPGYEVRRIIKSFVDAQWLSEFDAKLEQYRNLLEQSSTEPAS